MAAADYRPYSGSCPRCRAALDLASVREAGVWYCSPACASGKPGAPHPARSVPESRLTNRPLRFHRRRAPKELKGSASGRKAIL